jgi:large subunit ribosomal protein L3
LRLHKIDVENNLLLIHGAVPGPNGGMLVIKATNKVGPGSRSNAK